MTPWHLKGSLALQRAALLTESWPLPSMRGMKQRTPYCAWIQLAKLCSRSRDIRHRLLCVPAVQHGQRLGAGKVFGAQAPAQHASVAQQAETEDGR